MPRLKKKDRQDLRYDLFVTKTKHIPITRAMPRLKEKYGISEIAIYNEWGKRDEWIPGLFEVEDSEHFIENLRRELDYIDLVIWGIADNTNNDAVALGALKIIREGRKEMVDILQSVGQVPKEPERFEVLLDIVAQALEGHPEIRDKVTNKLWDVAQKLKEKGKVKEEAKGKGYK